MKKITKYVLLIISIFTLSIFTTGCGNDEMDGIDIAVTNYANEYIVDRLYGKHAKITSIYPDGVDTSTYKLSKKQKESLLMINSLFGSVLMTSDNIGDYNEEAKKQLAYAFELFYNAKDVKYERDKEYIYIEYTLNDKQEKLKYNTKKGEIVHV